MEISVCFKYERQKLLILRVAGIDDTSRRSLHVENNSGLDTGRERGRREGRERDGSLTRSIRSFSINYVSIGTNRCELLYQCVGRKITRALYAISEWRSRQMEAPFH